MGPLEARRPLARAGPGGCAAWPIDDRGGQGRFPGCAPTAHEPGNTALVAAGPASRSRTGVPFPLYLGKRTPVGPGRLARPFWRSFSAVSRQTNASCGS